MGTLLEVKDLTTYFFTSRGTVKAVDGVSWDINKGETVGLVGESGSGKSVTALSIMRLISPPGRIIKGNILFNGKDLLKIKEQEMRHLRGSQIAMIFQEPMTSLNPVLTIERQLTEPFEVHLRMNKMASRNRAIQMLRLVGISDVEKRIGAYPYQFSGGMNQRVMIAMAISCDPALLIADEPTTAVDVTIQAQLLEIMKDMTQRLGTALIITTHNLGLVARYAQRVNVMYAGRIVEKGLTWDIFGNPRHPYTIGLISSIPRLDQTIKGKLAAIDGMPPDLTEIPPTCSFLPRCNCAVDACRMESMPGLRQVGDNHWTACRLNDLKGCGSGK